MRRNSLRSSETQELGEAVELEERYLEERDRLIAAALDEKLSWATACAEGGANAEIKYKDLASRSGQSSDDLFSFDWNVC